MHCERFECVLLQDIIIEDCDVCTFHRFWQRDRVAVVQVTVDVDNTWEHKSKGIGNILCTSWRSKVRGQKLNTAQIKCKRVRKVVLINPLIINVGR